MIVDLLKRLLDDRGIAPENAAYPRFSTYYEMLREANAKMNLTRIEGEEDTAQMHFLDSLSPLWLKEIPLNARCIDVGAGAGFPSIPLAITRPDISVTLLEAVGKKASFLNECRQFAPNISAIHARAEDLAREKGYREAFDAAFARGVAPLNILCEYVLPFVKPGGFFIAWKGPAAQEELSHAKKAIKTLGGDPDARIFEYTLKDGEYQRRLIVIDKIHHTPLNFPRKPQMIRNTPIS